MFDEWYTPQWLVDDLVSEFGIFDLDPCCTPESAKAPKFFTIEDDGLSQPWFGRVFMNPPYSKGILPWVTKVLGEVNSGNAEMVVALLPIGNYAKWIEEAWTQACTVRPIFQRLQFDRPDGTQLGIKFMHAIFVFRSDHATG